MDRDEKIIYEMLKQAKQKMLYSLKWDIYGCSSQEEAENFIEALLAIKYIHKEPLKITPMKLKGKPSMQFSEAQAYNITPLGQEELDRLAPR